MATVTPNPLSPFSNADPSLRHLFAVPFFDEHPPQPPQLNTLQPTGCARLAVVPPELAEVFEASDLPEGVCPMCVAAMRTGAPLEDSRPTTACRECGVATRHDGLCALCRQGKHERWRTGSGGRS